MKKLFILLTITFLMMRKDGNQMKFSPQRTLPIHFIRVKMLIERD